MRYARTSRSACTCSIPGDYSRWLAPSLGCAQHVVADGEQRRPVVPGMPRFQDRALPPSRRIRTTSRKRGQRVRQLPHAEDRDATCRRERAQPYVRLYSAARYGFAEDSERVQRATPTNRVSGRRRRCGSGRTFRRGAWRTKLVNYQLRRVEVSDELKAEHVHGGAGASRRAQERVAHLE